MDKIKNKPVPLVKNWLIKLNKLSRIQMKKDKMQIWNKKIDSLIYLSLTSFIKISHLKLNKYRKLSPVKLSPPVKFLEVLWKVLIF